MEQIIQAISAKLNLPESVVRSGVGIILNFVKQKAAGTQFEQFLAAVPGADGILADAPTGDGGAAGLLGGLLGKAGGLLGGDLGGAASALAALQQAGIPMDKAAPLASEFFEQAKAAAGPETVNSLVEGIPALQAFLGSKK
ncbi:MAG: DUF2780 domain-containing protein [Terrimicrobiaceae bacterium]|jgi:hypothetical protein